MNTGLIDFQHQQYQLQLELKSIDMLSQGPDQGAEMRRGLFSIQDNELIQRHLKSNSLEQIDDVKSKNLKFEQSNNNKTFEKSKPNYIQQTQQPQLQQQMYQRPPTTSYRSKSKTMKQFKKANIIKKSISKFFNLIRFQFHKKLKYHHFQIINDLAYYPEKSDQKCCCDNSNNQTQKCFQFNPQSNQIRVWKIFIFICQIFLFLFYPITIGFSLDDNIFQEYSSIPTFIFFVDIVVSLNTGIYNNIGSLVFQPKMIVQQYINNQLVGDIINILQINVRIDSVFYLIFCFIFRSSIIKVLIQQIDDKFQIKNRWFTQFSLIKLLFIIFSIAHYCGCVFYMIGRQEIPETSWITKYQLQEESIYNNYINIIYFAIITMQTIGYGDIVPATPKEKIYITFATILACGVFAYSVNVIGSIFSKTAQEESEYIKNKFILKQYLEQRQISSELQERTIMLFEYQNKEQALLQQEKEGENILNSLSNQIKNEVQRDYYRQIVFSNSFFLKHFSVPFLNQLIHQVKEITVGPGEVLYQKGSNDQKLYIVCRGSLEVFLELKKDSTNITVLGQKLVYFKKAAIIIIKLIIQKGDFVGEQEFFCQNLRQQSVRGGTKVSLLIYIEESQFFNILSQFPEDYEIYCQIRDKSQQQQQQVINFCLYCNQTNHISCKCPYISFNIDKEKAILKYKLAVNKYENKNIKRRKKHKMHTILDLKIISKKAKQKRIELIIAINKEYEEQLLQLSSFEKFKDQEFSQLLPAIIFKQNEMFLQEADDEYQHENNHDVGFLDNELIIDQQEGLKDTFCYNKQFIKSLSDNQDDCSNNQNINNIYEKNEEYSYQKSSQNNSPLIQKNKDKLELSIQQTSLIKLKNMNQSEQVTNNSTGFMIIDKFDARRDFVKYMPYNNYYSIIHSQNSRIQHKRRAAIIIPDQQQLLKTIKQGQVNKKEINLQ